MEIKRDLYLNKLINRKHNGLIKVITGIRRCGIPLYTLNSTTLGSIIISFTSSGMAR